MVNIAQSTILELAMPLPPTIKQEALVGFIDRETDKIDELMAGAQRSIVLLTERRAALISAAVTGKIDVRGVVPDVQQAA
jgi:type I restriction enzyme S subunit